MALTCEYRGYLIRRNNNDGQPDAWVFSHPDYDGAPIEPGGPPADKRFGYAATIDQAEREIDILEDGE